MESFLRDLRYVTRSLVRTPAFFAVTVLTLALGIGATTAIFSVIDGVLLRALPYPAGDRIVHVWQVNAGGQQNQFSEVNFEDVQAQSRSFSAMALMTDGGVVSVTGGAEPVRVRLGIVSADFFRVLGVQPARGRPFTPEELRVGAPPAVLVSHQLWQRQLGANPQAVASGTLTLTFEGRAFTVVGVLPPSVDYPTGVDLWIPRELSERNPYRTGHNWQVIARLRDGVTLEQARGETSALAKRLRQQYGDDTAMLDAALVPLREQIAGRARPTLLVLLGASAFLLLIACANVVNLLVARMAARQGELALRLALGAGRGRIAVQFLVESLVLSVLGGAAGVMLATLGLRALLALEPGNLPRTSEIGLSLPVLGFALGVSVLAATALGLLTAWRGTRGDLREALAQAQRTSSGAGSSHRIRSTLVVTQVALTLVLLVGVGILGRSFLKLIDIDPGFQRQRITVMDVSVPNEDSVAARLMLRYYADLTERLRAIPGVREVGGVNRLPLGREGTTNGTFLIMRSLDERVEFSPKLFQDTSRTGSAEFRIASGGYFRAMHIPLVRGRLFDARDVREAPHVAVISASLAAARWPNADPIGKIIQFGNMDGDLTPFTIVGIVGDVRERSLAVAPVPTFYASVTQRPRPAGTFNFVMEGSGDPAGLIAAARRASRELRPDVVPRFRTIETVVSTSVADRRFVLFLVGVFGVAALILATLGVYSVISYLVTQRRQEISIRIALGARTDDVLRLVLRQGATLALIGIVIGAAAALALTRLLSGLVFGVSTADPLSFGGVMALLALVALLASFVPARRAARVEPAEVLRGS
jgi:putative ABC transport system permease protein